MKTPSFCNNYYDNTRAYNLIISVNKRFIHACDSLNVISCRLVSYSSNDVDRRLSVLTGEMKRL